MTDNSNNPILKPRWSICLVLLGLAALAFLIDPRVTNILNSTHVRTRVEPWLMFLLDGAAGLIIIGVMHQLFRRWEQWVGVVLPIVLSSLLTHAIKTAVGRARPKIELGPFHFNPFPGDADFASFPSGHTSYAVTIALLLGILFPRARWLFIILAALTAFERVFHREHYVSDVLAGAAVGLFSVYLCVRLLPNRYYQALGPDPRQGV